MCGLGFGRSQKLVCTHALSRLLLSLEEPAAPSGVEGHLCQGLWVGSKHTGCGHAWWPGGLSAHRRPPFPLFLPSLAAYTPAARSQAVQSWAGGVWGVGLTDTLGGGEHWRQLCERGIGGPDTRLLRDKRRRPPLSHDCPIVGGRADAGVAWNCLSPPKLIEP